MQPIDVLTVGHALVDVLAPTDEAVIEAEGLSKGSMQLIDDDRARELYQKMGPGSEASGGSAANTATGVVACGGTASFIGTVAYDQLGEIFTHDIRASGVAFKTPPVPGAATGRSLILVTPDGERTMNTFIGAAEHVSISRIHPSVLRSSKVTYVEGYLLDSRFSVQDWQKVASVIHEAGNMFAITLSDSFCVERHRDLFLELLNGDVDVCFGNDDELRALYESDDLEYCKERIAKQCRYAAITRGAQGSIVSDGQQWYDVPAEKVDAVDTTGAGDLYAAGFLAGLARGWDVERCGRLVSLAAGEVVSHFGARLNNTRKLDLPA